MKVAKKKQPFETKQNIKIVILKDFKINNENFIKESTNNDKNIYFKTILEQYYILAGNTSKDIGSCPAYHNEFLNYPRPSRHLSTDNKITFDIDFNRLNSNTYLASKPELFLITNGRPVLDQMTNLNYEKLLTKAIRNHTDQIFEELTYLCKIGTSPNLTIYLNMLNSISKLTPDNVFTIPITLNAALIKSLHGQTRDLSSVLPIKWPNDYLKVAIP